MTDGFGRLMERNEQLVRANVRLSNKLGRKCYWLNGVEAKLGMSVREYLELPDAPEPSGQVVALTRYRELEKERDEALAGKAAAEGSEAGLLDRLATLDKNYGKVVNEREDALERHKQAHDRAMALHVVIDHAVEELRKISADNMAGTNRVIAHNAIHILVNDERVKEAAAEVEALRTQCAAVHPAEDMRRWRKAAGCREGQTLLERIEVLTANAANEAEKRNDVVEGCHKLECRMSEAAQELRKAFAHEVRGDDEASRRCMASALHLLSSDLASDPNIVDEGGES